MASKLVPRKLGGRVVRKPLFPADLVQSRRDPGKPIVKLAIGDRKQVRVKAERPMVIPLEKEARATLTTGEAAAHLNRAAQTLRVWACLETGPLRPIRVNGRLAWRVSDLRRLLGGEE
jgi:hypothetical protein